MILRKYGTTPIGEYRKSHSALPRPGVGTPFHAFSTREPSQVMSEPRFVRRKLDARGTDPLGCSSTPVEASTPLTNAPELDAFRVTESVFPLRVTDCTPADCYCRPLEPFPVSRGLKMPTLSQRRMPISPTCHLQSCPVRPFSPVRACTSAKSEPIRRELAAQLQTGREHRAYRKSVAHSKTATIRLPPCRKATPGLQYCRCRESILTSC